jgi:hypothetical protein
MRRVRLELTTFGLLWCWNTKSCYETNALPTEPTSLGWVGGAELGYMKGVGMGAALKHI